MGRRLCHLGVNPTNSFPYRLNRLRSRLATLNPAALNVTDESLLVAQLLEGVLLEDFFDTTRDLSASSSSSSSSTSSNDSNDSFQSAPDSPSTPTHELRQTFCDQAVQTDPIPDHNPSPFLIDESTQTPFIIPTAPTSTTRTFPRTYYHPLIYYYGGIDNSILLSRVHVTSARLYFNRQGDVYEIHLRRRTDGLSHPQH